MRRTLIAALVVLALSAALCAVSNRAVGDSVNRTRALLEAAERAARLGNVDGALARAREMKAGWQADGRWLELLISHDALSDVGRGIDDALCCLENSDRAEFLRAGAAVAAALERLSATEAVRLMNLF